jgi:glycosyltransferase involved in cell wall biosynthesis
VIGLKFPAYFVKHPNKVIWILHQHKMAYELWGTPFGDLNLTTEGTEVRNAIIKADNEYLPEAKRLFAISKNVADRLKKFNHLHAAFFYHPPPNHQRLYSDGYENYIFYPSRLSPMKRQHIAIEAMRYVRSNVRLVIAGSAETVEYEIYLRRLIDEYSLHEKVRLLGGITEDEKIKLYANALAVLFIPYDEDYGYVTLEAFYSKKAVITCDDSGGPLEFVTHKETGIVCRPLPEPIAEAIEHIANKASQAATYGKNAHHSITDLSWDKVIEVLTC